MAQSPLPPLIQALCQPALHGNPKGGVRLVETHISWVILTGEYAYKIKKPVDFGFLDFSTLALRHAYCEEELRLNRRLAPFLYLGVVAITGEPGNIGFDGAGPVLEYAVKLRQFDESCLADRLLGQNRLMPAQIDRLAQTLADFHSKAARAGPGDTLGNPATILATAEHNFGPLLRLCRQLDATPKTDCPGLYQTSVTNAVELTDVTRNCSGGGFFTSLFEKGGLRGIFKRPLQGQTLQIPPNPPFPKGGMDATSVPHKLVRNISELSVTVPSPNGGGLGWGRVKSMVSFLLDRPPPGLPPLGGGVNSTALTSGADREGGELTAGQMQLNRLLSWTRAEFQRLEGVFRSRKQDGFVRECHGDLHSGNLVLIGGDLVPFDCIEFSEDLRWIDCISEIAFLFMDIAERGHTDLAWRLLNRYVEISGDYAGLEVLNFYCVYRALVRAKVAALSLEQAREPGERAAWQTQCQRYLDYASQDRKQTPALVLTHGFSGSGKSSVAQALAERLPAIRIASDRERKRLAGLDTLERSEAVLQDGIYSESMTRETYALLLRHAERLLRCGFNVILDATYLNAANRLPCRALADRLGVRFLILDFHAPAAVLSARITERLRRGGDPSEADPAVLAMQAAKAEPLDPDEIPFVLPVDTTQEGGIDDILRVILPLTEHGPAHLRPA